jgi:hypothetical protein
VTASQQDLPKHCFSAAGRIRKFPLQRKHLRRFSAIFGSQRRERRPLFLGPSPLGPPENITPRCDLCTSSTHLRLMPRPKTASDGVPGSRDKSWRDKFKSRAPDIAFMSMCGDVLLQSRTSRRSRIVSLTTQLTSKPFGEEIFFRMTSHSAGI